MQLTKKSKENFYNNKYNGYGAIFIKTGDKEITEIEFNLGRNGKLYTVSKTLLTERLNELAMTISEEEAEQ